MRIIRMSGALGNQMFKYAVYCMVKHYNPYDECVLDDNIYRFDKTTEIALFDIFNIRYNTWEEKLKVSGEWNEMEKILNGIENLPDENKSISYYKHLYKKRRILF